MLGQGAPQKIFCWKGLCNFEKDFVWCISCSLLLCVQNWMNQQHWKEILKTRITFNGNSTSAVTALAFTVTKISKKLYTRFDVKINQDRGRNTSSVCLHQQRLEISNKLHLILRWKQEIKLLYRSLDKNFWVKNDVGVGAKCVADDAVGPLHRGNGVLVVVWAIDAQAWNTLLVNLASWSHALGTALLTRKFKEILHILQIQAPSMMHKIMAFALSIISPDRTVSLNQLIISWKVASCDTLVISRMDFRHDHCKWKIFGKVDGSQNARHDVFSWVFIPPCKLRNLVAEQWLMTNLRCRTILPAQTLVSQ